jgi:hypothetical protein
MASPMKNSKGFVDLVFGVARQSAALRFLACFTLLSALGACSRLNEMKLIGTWRSENEDGVTEISLRQDYSFLSLETFKKEFVQPSLIEVTGSWRLKGNHLLLDSITTWSKNRQQFDRTVVQITESSLVLKSFNGTSDVFYQRFEEPLCPSTGATVAISESALLGLWESHHSTHDYQYRFGPEASFEVLTRVGTEMHHLFRGRWAVQQNRILIEYEEDFGGRILDEEDRAHTWRVSDFSGDCFTAEGDFPRSRIIRRVR